jgi:hypothetical protein
MKISPIKLIALLGFAYRLVLRDLIQEAIDDPDTEWDDAVMAALDKIFGYDEVG